MHAQYHASLIIEEYEDDEERKMEINNKSKNKKSLNKNQKNIHSQLQLDKQNKFTELRRQM